MALQPTDFNPADEDIPTVPTDAAPMEADGTIVTNGSQGGGTGSTTADDYLAKNLAFMEMYTGPADYLQRLKTSKADVAASKDPYQLVQQKVHMARSRIAQSRADRITKDGAKPEDIEAARREQEALLKNVTKPYLLEVVREAALKNRPEALTGLIAYSKAEGEVNKANVADNYKYQVAEQVMESKGWGGKLVDFASVVLIAPTLTAFTVGFNDPAWGEGFGFEKYRKLLDNYQSMTQEEQLLAFPAIASEIANTTTNYWVYGSMIEPFVDPEASQFWLKLDLASDALTLSQVTKMLYKTAKFWPKLVKNRNAVNLLLQAGRADDAAGMLKLAFENEEAMKVLGLSKETSVSELLPFSFKEVAPEVIGGLADKVAKQLNAQLIADRAEVISTFNKLMDNTFIPNRTGTWFEESKKLALQEKFVGAIKMPNEATITARTPEGFTVEMKYNDTVQDTAALDALDGDLASLRTNLDEIQYEIKNLGDEGTPEELAALGVELERTKAEITRIDSLKAAATKTESRTESIEIKYSRNEFGELDSITSQQGIRGISSPDVLLSEISKDAIGTFNRMQLDSEKIRAAFGSMSKSLYSRLNQKSVDKINRVLQHGDAIQKEYTPLELARGVLTPGGTVRMTAEEITSYVNTRLVFDKLDEIKNMITRREMEIDGWGVTPLAGINKGANNPRAFLRWEDGQSIIPPGVNRVYDKATDTIIDVPSNRTGIDARLASGNWKMIRTKDMFKEGNEYFNYVLAKENQISKNLPQRILSKLDGYVPRIRPKVHWIVKEQMPIRLNGSDAKLAATSRFFDSSEEAKLWISQQPAGTEFMEPMLSKERSLPGYRGYDDEFDMTNFGTTFGSARSDRNILMGLNGKEAELVSPITALQQYLDHIADRIPIFEYRMAMVSRFLRSAAGKLADNGDWRSPIVGFSKGSLEYRNLEIAQDFLETLHKVPTTSETLWQNMMIRIGRALEPAALSGKSYSGIVDSARRQVMDFSTKDPFAFWHTAAFHSTLGIFNPRQYIVQGLGFINAMAVDPLRAPKYMRQYMAMRPVLFTKYRHNAEIAAHAVGLDPKEFGNLWEDMQKSGVGWSVHNSADWAAQTVEQSKSMQGVKALLEAGTIPVKEGELLNRLYAWFMAYDKRLRKGGPGGRRRVARFTQKELDEITDESFNYSLLMTRANKAAWQKGALKPMTQFWQYTAKMTESLLPHALGARRMSNLKLTPSEKARIMLTQGALFGAAGYGAFTSEIITELENTVAQFMSKEELDPEKQRNVFNLYGADTAMIRKFIHGGVIEGALYAGTGINITASKRLGWGEGVNAAFESFGKEDISALEFLAGVSASMPVRFFNAYGNTMKTLGAVNLQNFDERIVYQLMTDVSPLASSLSNATKAALLLEWKQIRDSKGRLIVDLWDGEERELALAQFLGFPDARVEENRQYMLYNMATEADINARADAIVSIYQRYGKNEEVFDDPKGVDFIGGSVRLVLADVYKGVDRGEAGAQAFLTKVMKRVDSRMKEENNLLFKNMEKAHENLYLRDNDPVIDGANIGYNLSSIPENEEE